MNHISLAAKYRPQRFKDVAGQPMAAVALSRAALEDKVAPAYLLSGTRGVGKTTIARIFAKALNCEHSPCAEPCNECAQCKHITAGNHVDVSEIDGASNTGVDDVRALRETIGFMPMEGRYKIFIVDEAHMLSKNAFNALLKTLEEPPKRTVFIFATTEAHRFPATIISRCQHFVFRHLPEAAIYEHLAKVLGLESVQFEENALHLLAKRAAGSVRDSLSLLDQALSISQGQLTADSVREALGVAGPELFANLLTAIAKSDLAQIVEIGQNLLRTGVDLGYFTRELGATFRNLFLLRQAGDKIMPSLGIASVDEQQSLKAQSQIFSPGHLHGAWQMTLESQRGIAQSPEPGAALELLLLNLALLPQLLPVGAAKPQGLAGQAPQVDDTAGAPVSTPASEAQPAPESEPAPIDKMGASTPKNWAAFCDYCKQSPMGLSAPILRQVQCQWNEQGLRLSFPSVSLAEQIEQKRAELENALKAFCGGQLPPITYVQPAAVKTNREMMAECEQEPGVQLCREILGARMADCEQKPPEQ